MASHVGPRSLAGPHLAPAAEPVAPLPLAMSAFGMHLHAATTLDGRDRQQLERLCRDLLRPPFAHDASAEPGDPSEARTPRRIGWACLLARVFAADVTVCRKCGGLAWREPWIGGHVVAKLGGSWFTLDLRVTPAIPLETPACWRIRGLR